MSVRYGSPKLRHEGAIGALAVSPDGRWIAASATLPDDTAVWDLASGERVVSIDAAAGFLSWSPDGRELTGAFSRVDIWAIPSGARVARVSNAGQPAAVSADGSRAWREESSGHVHVDGVGTIPIAVDRALAFDRSGARLVACADGKSPAVVIDRRTGQRITSLGRGAVDAVFLGPDRLVVANEGDVTLHRVDSGEELWTADIEDPKCLARSPDGTQIAVAAWFGRVFLIEVSTGRVRALREARSSEGAVAFIDDSTFAVGTGNRIAIHDLPSGAPRPAAIGHDSSIRAVAAARRAPVVATAGGDHRVQTWHRDTGEPIGAFGHDNAIGAVALSADGELVLTSAADDRVRLFGPDGSVRWELESRNGAFDEETVAFSPDERHLIVDAAEGAVIWDRERDHRYELELERGPAVAVDFLTDDMAVVLVPKVLYAIRFHDSAIEIVARFDWPTEMERMAVGRESGLIAVAEDYRVEGFRFRGGALERVFCWRVGFHVALAVTDDGVVVAAETDSLALFDSITGKRAGSTSMPRVPACLTAVPGEHEVLIGWRNGTASRVALPPTPRLRAEKEEAARRARLERAINALRKVAQRGSPGGYRGGGPAEGLHDDGLGVTLDGDPPVTLRVALDDDALGVTIRCGDPNPLPVEDPGLLDRVRGWFGGEEPTPQPAVGLTAGAIVGADWSASASLRQGPRGAELTLRLTELPPPEQVGDWMRALRDAVPAWPEE